MIKCTERSGVYQAVKRLFDILASLAALAVLSPLFLVIAILILSEDGRPVFYKHTRVGKGGKTFQMYKFRTMYQDRRIVLTPEQQVELQQEFKLENDPRVTRIGSKLRMSSLDELPQLLNILKGDMSIVGPRPLLVKYLPWYTEAERHRHDVRPGLTGWAQVNGRNFISWEETFDFDLYYVKKISLFLDIKIIFLSVKKVLSRADITDATQGVNDSSGKKVHDALDAERRDADVK